jgi:UPF0755 protein
MNRNYISRILKETWLQSSQLAIGTIVFIISFFVVFTSRYSRIYNSSAIRSDSTSVIYLYHDTDIHQLNIVMDSSGISYDSTEMFWVSKMLGWRKFKQGRYVVNKPYSYNSFLKKLAMGSQDPVRVTILPGSNEHRFADRVAKHFIFSADSLVHTMNDSTILASYGVTKKDVFGRMLPNTYRFYWNMSPKQFIGRMIEEFNRLVVLKYKDRFFQLNKSVDQVLTLASIVEWEAKKDSEKAIISGLYWNRLKKGWYLQADPTINYIIGKRRRLLYKDYKIDNPYNTYENRGLPPGPITNPSMSSIKAALFPAHHDYMYMVAKPNGDGHAFSKTLAKHEEQSARWRKWLRKQYRIKRERERQADSAKN